jgi:hypothetical protein
LKKASLRVLRRLRCRNHRRDMSHASSAQPVFRQWLTNIFQAIEPSSATAVVLNVNSWTHRATSGPLTLGKQCRPAWSDQGPGLNSRIPIPNSPFLIYSRRIGLKTSPEHPRKI